MKCWLKHFVTILVFLIQRCETAEESSSEHLTSEMYFETVRQSKRSSFVMFFQAWCGNSKRLQPDWERLAAKYKFEASLMIGGVNCGEEGPLCKHKDIRNYPSLLYYIDGEEYEYNGPRSYDDLVDFVETTLLPQCETQLPATTCSIKAQSYISKWVNKDFFDVQKESVRLEKLLSSSKDDMKPDIRRWVRERIQILRQLLQTTNIEL